MGWVLGTAILGASSSEISTSRAQLCRQRPFGSFLAGARPSQERSVSTRCAAGWSNSRDIVAQHGSLPAREGGCRGMLASVLHVRERMKRRGIEGR